MKFVIDMNLSPGWVKSFEDHGFEAVHWSEVGNPRASDREIMEWSDKNGYVVFTHDLDFTTLLAATQANGPSVIQLRTQNFVSEKVRELLFDSIQQYGEQLRQGALISIEYHRSKIRIHPFKDN
jgi:predicted nuclease of predicted toxin-antitoxin system